MLRRTHSQRGALVSLGQSWILGSDTIIRIFRNHANIDPHPVGIRISRSIGAGPFDDQNGHGTHVAGIIAGEWRVPADAPKETRGLWQFRAT